MIFWIRFCVWLLLKFLPWFLLSFPQLSKLVHLVEVTWIIPDKSTTAVLFLALWRSKSQEWGSKIEFQKLHFHQLWMQQNFNRPKNPLSTLSDSTTCSVLLSGQFDGLPPLLLRHGNVAHLALTPLHTSHTLGCEPVTPSATHAPAVASHSERPKLGGRGEKRIVGRAMGLNSPEPNPGPRTCTSWFPVPVRGDYFGDVSIWEGEVGWFSPSQPSPHASMMSI